MATPRRHGNIAFAHTAHEGGVTLIDVAIAVGLIIVTLIASLVAGSRYMSQRTLLGWTDVIVSDVRAAQQLGIGKRAAVVVTFAAQSGSIAASYTTAVGGSVVRQQSLPAELNLPSTTVQFNSLGVPSSGTAVTIQVTDSLIGAAKTITVIPGTGAVQAQ